MGLRDTVCSMSTDPPHDGAKVAQKVTVEGGKGTASESEFGSTVVGEERVGVLEESDQHQPVVDPNNNQYNPGNRSYRIEIPKIRNEVDPEDVQEAPNVDATSDAGEPEQDTNSGDEHLEAVVRHEHGRVGIEVCK